MTDVYPRIETGNAAPANPPAATTRCGSREGASLALEQVACMECSGIRVFGVMVAQDSPMLHSELRWLGWTSAPLISAGCYG